MKFWNTNILPSNFTNRVDNYGCGSLGYARFKINRKMSEYILHNNPNSASSNYPQQLPDFSSGVNPKWYALLQAKRDYIDNLIEQRCLIPLTNP